MVLRKDQVEIGNSGSVVMVRRVTCCESREIDRRTFLFAGFAAAMSAAIDANAETPRLETLTEWLNDSRKSRQSSLQPCLDRIREMDPSIYAWAHVLPKEQTRNGKLSELP